MSGLCIFFKIFFYCVAQMTKSELLNWYCEEIEKDVESQDEMLERRQIAEKVIDRLSFADNVLIPISKTGLSRKAGAEGDGPAEDPVLVVHPNYVCDD